MQNVYLMMHQMRHDVHALTTQVRTALLAQGLNVHLEPWLSDVMGEAQPPEPAAPMDVIVAVGGDGTLLRATKRPSETMCRCWA